jgi:Flp pilus assembly protein TadG
MRANRPRRRKGQVAVEMLLVLPILLAVLVGTVEFSLWLTAQQQVNLATREGARAAATGGSAADVNHAVRLALGDQRFQQATVQAHLNDSAGNPLPSGQPVSVLVQLPAGAVVPDLLAFVGLSIRNQTLIGQTVMRKE